MQDEFGPVHLRIEGDVGRGRTYIRAAHQLRLNLLRVLEGEEVSQGAMARYLDDGVYAYVRKYGDLQVVGIVADPVSGDDADVDASGILFPSFLSGTVFGGLIVADRLREFRPTPRTARLFGIPAERHNSDRLAVKPYSILSDELTPDGVDNASQYLRLKPSMYSGTMKKLVQLLLGYGKFSGTVPIYTSSDGGTSVVVDDRYLQDVSVNGTQVRYDWRFHRTHGLTRAEDGRWWLVQVFLGVGVHAIPLPLYEVTTTPEFRQAVEDAGDDEAIEVLDLFGGFPTGESFPAPGFLASWARAGLVLKGDPDNRLQEFYQHSWYGPWIGWAFNELGSEAHNTGWRTDPDKFQTGVHWSISLQIGNSRQKPTDNQDLRKRLKASLSSVASFNGVRPELAQLLPILLQKADWCSRDQLEQFVFMDSAESYLAFDAIEVAPIAPSQIRVGEVNSSRMYAPSRFTVQAKFYEPRFGLISHDFRAERGADILNSPPETDATVHVFFRQNRLVTLKAWIRPSNQPDTESSESSGTCSYDDSEQTFTSTFDGAANGMYSSEVDERQVSYTLQSSAVTTNKVRNTRQVQFGDRLAQPWISDVYRIWEIEKTLVVRQGGGRGVSCAAAVPRDMRESFFIAVRKVEFGSGVTTVRSYQTQRDAMSYSGWRNFPGFTGFLPMGCAGSPLFPSCWSLAEHPAGCGRVTYRAVWEPLPADPEECALGGDGWASPCQNIEEMPLYPGPPSSFNETTQVPQTSEIVVTFVCANVPESLVTLRATASGADADLIGDGWFTPSPGDGGAYQNIHAHGNEFGSATTIRHSNTIDDPPRTLYGSPSGLELRDGNWVYIGVMNA